jgi:hypothetical protein
MNFKLKGRVNMYEFSDMKARENGTKFLDEKKLLLV